MEAQDGATLEDVHAVMVPDPPAPGFSFPFGFFHFTIVLPPGEDSTILTVTLPDGETADTWVKNGPEPCNTQYHYYDSGDAARCPGAVDGVDISGNVITLHFTDSEDGDSDLTVNSRVVDPGSPGMVVVPTTTTTAASTTSTTAITTTSTTAVSSTTTSTPTTTAPTTTTSVACTSNDDCDDDGAFCNGDEVCVDGFCDHSGDPCQEGTTCVEESDQCVPVGIPCDCTIVPSTAAVASNESLHFTVSSTGDCLTPKYEWVVESAIGSGIDQSGNYQAGRNNNFFKETTDLVRVVDHANTVSDEATVSVYRECFLLNIYGENSKEIETLRGFRDGVLNETPHGQALISLYYQWSPMMGRVLAADEEFKEEVKELIDTIVSLLESSIN